MRDAVQTPVVDDGDVPAEVPADKPRGRVGRPRRDAGEPRLVSPDFARRLVAQAREEGLDIAGDSGLLGQLMKSVLEAALAEELTDHLGYEPGDPAGRGSGNSRNGSMPETVLTEAGPVELGTPRDRAGSFEPQIVRKGQRRLDGIDKIVLGLYAQGMTVRDIQAHLAEIHDVTVSPDLIRADRRSRPDADRSRRRARLAIPAGADLPRQLGHLVRGGDRPRRDQRGPPGLTPRPGLQPTRLRGAQVEDVVGADDLGDRGAER